MLDPKKRFVGRREYFGCLIYDRQKGDYIPFDWDAVEIFDLCKEFTLDEIYRRIEGNGRITQQSFETFVQLCRSIDLIDEKGNFAGQLISIKSPDNQVSAPLRVHLGVSYKCPLACKHCFSSSGDPLPGELTLDEVKSLLNHLVEIGTMEITLGGGEPLVRGDIFDIVSHAVSLGMNVNLSTSAVPINKTVARAIAEAGLKSIKVTFDGASEKTYDYIKGKGNYRKAVRGLRTLREFVKNIPIYLRVILQKPNITEIPSFVRIAERIRADALIFEPVKPYGRALKNPNILLSPQETDETVATIQRIKQNIFKRIEIIHLPYTWGRSSIYKGFGCVCGILFAYIDPVGNVAPSGYLVEKLPAGNIRKKSFKEIWDNGPGFKVMRNLDGNEHCNPCEYFQACRGGCRARTLALTGNINALDPMCTIPFRAPRESAQEPAVSRE